MVTPIAASCYMFSVVPGPARDPAVDRLLKQGYSLRTVRRLMRAAGLLQGLDQDTVDHLISECTTTGSEGRSRRILAARLERVAVSLRNGQHRA